MRSNDFFAWAQLSRIMLLFTKVGVAEIQQDMIFTKLWLWPTGDRYRKI